MLEAALELLSLPVVRFYRTPRMEKEYFAGNWGTVVKECEALVSLSERGLVRPWFEDHGENAPWLPETRERFNIRSEERNE